MRILIANRGEIARRIISTAHRLGHETVAVFADPDSTAPFVSEATTAVRIGPAALAESYLSVEAILHAAASTQADAIHPGYGFLSERAPFAREVLAAGLIWIGPHPDVIASMGSKIDARAIAEAAGVPTIPGWSDSQDAAQLKAAADTIGFPILVKAAAGGGGKGIRVAHASADFDQALSDASTEAERSFGDGAVIVERFVARPRHIEVQILGDKHGTCIDLGTRECSVQRRYQKLVEEAPAPNLPDTVRASLRAAAVALGRAVGYDSTGTVEFIVDGETWEWFFLEMNTRLQVEHPVTEAVTGVDLVEQQLLVASGAALALESPVALEGHAIEARINAEDPDDDWAPRTGTVHNLVVPANVRWDSGIVSGQEITPFYDPMVAKLIVSADTRVEAIAGLQTALQELIIDGVRTNGDFHLWITQQPEFVANTLTTRWLDEQSLDFLGDEDAAAALAGAAWIDQTSDATVRSASPWTANGPSRLVPHQPTLPLALTSPAGTFELTATGTAPETALVDRPLRRVAVNIEGRTWFFEVPPRSELWAANTTKQASTADVVVAPFPAVVAEVHVAVGDPVTVGQTVAVIEAMKMLHSMGAPRDGVVAEVRVEPGMTVAGGATLIVLESVVADDSH